jgi:hypothetical protein
MNLLEGKQQELDHLKQLAQVVLSRPMTELDDEHTAIQDIKNITGTLK